MHIMLSSDSALRLLLGRRRPATWPGPHLFLRISHFQCLYVRNVATRRSKCALEGGPDNAPKQLRPSETGRLQGSPPETGRLQGYWALRRRQPNPSERVRVAVKVSNSTGTGYGPEPDHAEVW